MRRGGPVSNTITAGPAGGRTRATGRPAPRAWGAAAGRRIGGVWRGLGMRVIGVSRTGRDIPGFASNMRTGELAAAAAKADFLINVLPASAENIGLFDAAVFAAMKPSAYFINVG